MRGVVVVVSLSLCLAYSLAAAEPKQEQPLGALLVGEDPKPTATTRVEIRDGALVVRPTPTLRSGADGPEAPYGEPDDESFPDVVTVGDHSKYRCSGVLVGPRHVLTAAHCASATSVGFGNTLTDLLHVSVNARHIHPTLDAAILVITIPSKLPIRARRTVGMSSPPLGAVRILGFGVRDQIRLTGFGTKRQVAIPLDGWGCTKARAILSGCQPTAEMFVRGARGNDTCLGDSGGPVFEVVEGQWRLLAITSRGSRPRKLICGEGGIYVRADRLDMWLQENLK